MPELAARLSDGDAPSRLREALPDWPAFRDASATPPPCVWARPGRVDGAGLAALLREEGVAAESLAWQADALRLPAGARPGLLWPFRAGLHQIQEEASLLPVALLAPRPGERVLDLCAAPGGKTARIAAAMDFRGTVVANDRSGRRLAAVRAACKRLGLVNVALTRWDGTGFPLAAGPFDRVLVDAPCSAERGFAPEAPRDARFRGRLAGVQLALLRRALALCRPGGAIVYSTCSLAPEENEAVVDAALSGSGGALRVAPVALAGLAAAPGLTAFAGRRFHPSLRHALRLWPHRTGTGGFFAVRLERSGAAAAAGPPDPLVLEPARPGERGLAEAMWAHFGIDAGALSGLRLVHRGRRWLHAVDEALRPPARPSPEACGVPLFKLAAAQPKPTTAAALLLGRHATRHCVEADPAQADAFLARRDFAPRPEQRVGCEGTGFVLVRRLGHPLGVGLLREGGQRVESQLPRAWVPEAERDDAEERP